MLKLPRCPCCGRIKLKPCPFCGNVEIIIKYYVEYYGKCNKCGATGVSKKTEKSAIKAWNKRRIV